MPVAGSASRSQGLADDQLVGAHGAREHLHALLAAHRDVHHAGGVLIVILDAGQRADGMKARRLAGFATLADQAHGKAALLAQALAHHAQIARLEDAQRQQAARVQHAAQRKHRQGEGLQFWHVRIPRLMGF